MRGGVGDERGVVDGVFVHGVKAEHAAYGQRAVRGGDAGF